MEALNAFRVMCICGVFILLYQVPILAGELHYVADDPAKDDVLVVDVGGNDYIDVKMFDTLEHATEDGFALSLKLITELFFEDIQECIGTIFSGTVEHTDITSIEETKTIKYEFKLKTTPSKLTISELPSDCAEYLPLYFDYMQITLPKGMHLHSAGPGPTSSDGGTLKYEKYDWHPAITIAYGAEEKKASVGEERVHGGLILHPAPDAECDSAGDGLCDPDCGEGADPDCVEYDRQFEEHQKTLQADGAQAPPPKKESPYTYAGLAALFLAIIIGSAWGLSRQR